MQRPLGGQDELMSRGFREPAHRPRPRALQALPPGRWGSGAASTAGPPRLSASGRFHGRRQVPRPAPRSGSFPVCVLRGGRGPAPRWWPREALRLPRPSAGSQNQAFASLSPSPTSLCLGSSVEPDTRVGTVLPTPRPLGSGLARTLRIRGVGQELVPGSHVGGRSPPGYSFGPGGTKTRDPFHRNGPLHWNMPKARGPLSPADDGAGSLSRGVLGLVGGWAVSLPPPMLGAPQIVMAADVPTRCPVSPGGDGAALSENSVSPAVGCIGFSFST